MLDADADRADLELRLIKLSLKDRARVHPFAGNGGSWRIVLKNSKIGGGFKNLANVACERIQPLQGSVKPIRAPAGVLAAIDVVPRVEAIEAHQQL